MWGRAGQGARPCAELTDRHSPPPGLWVSKHNPVKAREELLLSLVHHHAAPHARESKPRCASSASSSWLAAPPGHKITQKHHEAGKILLPEQHGWPGAWAPPDGGPGTAKAVPHQLWKPRGGRAPAGPPGSAARSRAPCRAPMVPMATGASPASVPQHYPCLGRGRHPRAEQHRPQIPLTCR